MTQPVKIYERGILNGTTEEPKQNYFEVSSTQNYEIGTRLVLPDGRAYRYAQAGAAALAAGELQSSAAFGGSSATVQADLTAVAAAIGDTTVSFTTATDATTLNQYAGGYLAVSDGGASIGQGELYKIVSNEAGAAGALLFVIDRPLTTAWTTSTRISIMADPYTLVVQSPATTAIGMPVGVPTVAVPINNFCWIQTWGMACCLVKLAMNAFSANVLSDLTAAGSVGIDDGALINATVGMTGLATATTDSGLIYLTIAP
jgi:hypothetical protein